MDYVFADHGLRLRVAESWVASSVGAQGVVAYPKEFAGTDPRYLRMSVHFVMHQTSEPLEQAARRIMLPRVIYEEALATTPVELGGFKGIEFDWTDGTMNVESDFIEALAGRVLEINFAIDPHYAEETGQPQCGLRDAWGESVDIEFLVRSAARL